MIQESFIQTIWSHYSHNKRSFPWRETTDPYAILVSEVMLQQTQTQRVVIKYSEWLQRFPTIEALAQASLSEVLSSWSGLGYNRRGKYLWEAAQIIKDVYSGVFPNSVETLRKLPGIGEYTANAVLAFAFNQPTVVLETNIRTVILHHFFSASGDEKIADTDIKKILEAVVDKKNPREWYYALMDYGNWLKSEGHHHFHKQKQYVKQKPFKGSERYVRGYLLRETLANKKLYLKDMKLIGYSAAQIRKVAADLAKEGLLRQIGRTTLTIV